MMTPNELWEKIQYYKLSGRTDYIDLEKQYNNEKVRSKTAHDEAREIAGKIREMMDNGEYYRIMKITDYYSSVNKREKLAIKFSELMSFFEKITPKWAENYNKKEEERTNNMSAKIDESEISIDKIVSDANKLPSGLYGNIEPETLRSIRITALTMFYANKIAHQSRYLRENILSHHLNYEIKSNDILEKNIKDGRFKEISNKLKNYYMSKFEYKEERDRGASEEDLNIILSDYSMRLKALEECGIDREDKFILRSKALSTLITSEKDAFSIKDIAMKDLINQLSRQSDILYGVKKDNEGKEVLVVDLPGYGQFSVHTKAENCMRKEKIPQYPYEVYGVDIGNVLLLETKSPTMNYILNKYTKKADIVNELIKLGDIGEAHQIAVKLGYNKNTLRKIHSEIGLNQSI